METDKRLTIAIDGYSSCGKSTFAKAIAAKLGYIFIDSGAMYRAATLYFIRAGLTKDGIADRDEIVKRIDQVKVSFAKNNVTGQNDTLLNGENVEREIREAPVSGNVSAVSRIAEVREKMVMLQRSIGNDGGIVMDGRDIGTVVFPEADIKIFMTATVEIRARRRYLELVEKNMEADMEAVMKNITDRDRIDETRSVSPLRKADDAIILDNSNLTPDQQMDWFMKIFSERINES